MTTVTWEEKSLFQFTFPGNISSLREVREETQIGQEPGGRADTEAMEGAAYWLPPHDLLSLLS